MKILCLCVLALGPVLSPTRGEERVFDESMLSQGITGDLQGRINVAQAAPRDESERLRLQFRIWETVFGHVLTTNDSNFVQ